MFLVDYFYRQIAITDIEIVIKGSMSYFKIVPLHLIEFPLQFPDSKHVLVTFPSLPSFATMTNPSRQINTHFDPHVLVQEPLIRRAPGGISKVGQVLALIIITINDNYDVVISITK